MTFDAFVKVFDNITVYNLAPEKPISIAHQQVFD